MECRFGRLSGWWHLENSVEICKAIFVLVKRAPWSAAAPARCEGGHPEAPAWPPAMLALYTW